MFYSIITSIIMRIITRLYHFRIYTLGGIEGLEGGDGVDEDVTALH
jgi:hypothetical protein